MLYDPYPLSVSNTFDERISHEIQSLILIGTKHSWSKHILYLENQKAYLLDNCACNDLELFTLSITLSIYTPKTERSSQTITHSPNPFNFAMIQHCIYCQDATFLPVDGGSLKLGSNNPVGSISTEKCASNNTSSIVFADISYSFMIKNEPLQAGSQWTFEPRPSNAREPFSIYD